MIRHLLAEGGVRLDSVCEDDGSPLVGWVTSKLLELLPVLESSEVEVQLCLVLENGQIRGFYRSKVVLCHPAAAGLGLLTSRTALTRPLLAALTLITRELLTASAAATLQHLVLADWTLADTTFFPAGLTALARRFLTLLAGTATLAACLMADTAAITVCLSLVAVLTALAGFCSYETGFAASAVIEEKATGLALADTVNFLTAGTALTLWLRFLAANAADTLVAWLA